MSSRLPARLRILADAVWQLLATAGRRRRPEVVRRILVAHPTKMLGDTLLLTPLLEKLRERYADAEICMTVFPAFLPLYQRPPYGIVPLPFDLRDQKSYRELMLEEGFDLAIIPGDNRNAWLALALGSRWIVGFDGDIPGWKNWLLDERTDYSALPGTWADMVAGLVEGPLPHPYRPADWPPPDFLEFPLPKKPYCVLHLGASNPLRYWEPDKWRSLADWLGRLGYAVVFSGGRGEEALVAEVDQDEKYASYAGQLDLPQMWHLLANASLLVSPDTGIAHLGRIVGLPVVTLFGQGSEVLFGAGEFWRDVPCASVVIEPFPCRDLNTLFKRRISWVRRCDRTRLQCAEPRCMQAISIDLVNEAVLRVLKPGAQEPALKEFS